MKTLTVRALTIGEGQPKIVVSVSAPTAVAAAAATDAVRCSAAELVEWRADSLAAEEDPIAALTAVRKAAGELPVLATFRTAAEGGPRALSSRAYEKFCRSVLDAGTADILDIEWSAGEEMMKRLIAAARETDTAVLLSSHDFEKTPPRQSLLARLAAMDALGADLAKLAVMPRSAEDVLTLLEVTATAAARSSCPIVTMSMGRLGAISRLCGESFGSALTFGAVGQSSAPGQIDAAALAQTLAALHRA